MSNEAVKVYTKEDFLDSMVPYEELYKLIGNKFALERALNTMSEMAKGEGVKNLRTLFKAYCDLQKKSKVLDYTTNVTNFEGQEMELDTGSWYADDNGVIGEGPFGSTIEACSHPIMPVQRLVNIDTGIEKLKIAYRKGKSWRHIICDKRQLASNNSIIGLAEYGVAVTSENSRFLVRYLHDVENLNYDSIPENNSVSRLGWIGGEGFSPYVEDLIFDGDISYKHFFESVKEKGSYSKWIDIVKKIRKGGVPARIMLASSFASILVEPTGALPFFVHLWGGTETGKTVGLLLAASVWANPEMGKYIHTFNSTAVAQELSAGFVNSLPLILDELQIIKERKDFDNMIYQLSEGVGRIRGAKTGGVQRVSTWNNCILTTGEQPITGSSSGSGAVNRIVEINCEDIRLFDDPVGVVEIIKKNYGFAGKHFVEQLQEPDGMDAATTMQKQIYKEILKNEITEKQALAASLILTADALIDLWLFKDDQTLHYDDITPFLSTRAEVSANVRAYSWFREWLAQNKSNFMETSSAQPVNTWGRFAAHEVYIIRSIFDKACRENGFSPQSFLSWLKSQGYISTHEKGFTKTQRINGVPCNCVVLDLSRGLPDGFYEDLES